MEDSGDGGLEGRIEAEDRESPIEEGHEPRAESREEYDSGEKVVYHSKDTGESRQTKSKKEEKGKSRNLESIASESKESGEHGKIHKGTVVFFYNKETGEFLLEENPGKYAIREERYKLRPPGGQKESYDSSSYETAYREIGEEVLQEDAKKALRKYLWENGKSVATLREIINGQLTETEILEVEVPYSPWMAKVRKVRATHDAGTFHILRDDEIRSKPDNAFASIYGPILKDFISEKLVHGKDFLNHYKSSNYALPIITTNSYHLNAVNSFNNYTPSLN